MNNKKRYICPSFEATEVESDAAFMLGSGPDIDTSEPDPDENPDNSDKTNKKHRQRSIWDAQSGDMWG